MRVAVMVIALVPGLPLAATPLVSDAHISAGTTNRPANTPETNFLILLIFQFCSANKN